MRVRPGKQYVALDHREHAGLVVHDDVPGVALCRQRDPAEFVEREAVRSADVPDTPSGAPVATSKTAEATSAAAIGWTGVTGSRTVLSSEVQDMTAFMNSKNWVARTIEYGVGPSRSSSSWRALAR